MVWGAETGQDWHRDTQMLAGGPHTPQSQHSPNSPNSRTLPTPHSTHSSHLLATPESHLPNTGIIAVVSKSLLISYLYRMVILWIAAAFLCPSELFSLISRNKKPVCSLFNMLRPSGQSYYPLDLPREKVIKTTLQLFHCLSDFWVYKPKRMHLRTCLRKNLREASDSP